MTKLEHAQQFLSNGIATIPLRHRGKEPESSMIKSWEPYRTTLPTEYQLLQWLGSNWQNYGVVCGWRDLVVIDFDDAAAFDIWLNYFAILNKHEEIYPMPYIVKTARGAHVYVSMPNRGDMTNEKRKGVDIKVHGYVVGPGSTHPSGAIYEPTTEYRLVEVYSLDTILPVEIFPKIENQPLGEFFRGVCKPVVTPVTPADYDPFQAAMFATDGDLITTVKARARIEDFFTTTYKTSADGRWLSTLCIFHNDHNPSMWIDTKRQLCGCNTCGFKALDVINLYGRIHNLSDAEAVKSLAKDLHIWG